MTNTVYSQLSISLLVNFSVISISKAKFRTMKIFAKFRNTAFTPIVPYILLSIFITFFKLLLAPLKELKNIISGANSLKLISGDGMRGTLVLMSPGVPAGIHQNFKNSGMKPVSQT